MLSFEICFFVNVVPGFRFFSHKEGLWSVAFCVSSVLHCCPFVSRLRCSPIHPCPQDMKPSSGGVKWLTGTGGWSCFSRGQKNQGRLVLGKPCSPRGGAYSWDIWIHSWAMVFNHNSHFSSFFFLKMMLKIISCQMCHICWNLEYKIRYCPLCTGLNLSYLFFVSQFTFGFYSLLSSESEIT